MRKHEMKCSSSRAWVSCYIGVLIHFKGIFAGNCGDPLGATGYAYAEAFGFPPGGRTLLTLWVPEGFAYAEMAVFSVFCFVFCVFCFVFWI